MVESKSIVHVNVTPHSSGLSIKWMRKVLKTFFDFLFCLLCVCLICFMWRTLYANEITSSLTFCQRDFWHFDLVVIVELDLISSDNLLISRLIWRHDLIQLKLPKLEKYRESGYLLGVILNIAIFSYILRRLEVLKI